MNAAYWLFRLHHIMPSELRDMLPGERRILYAFVHYEIEQRNRENSTEGG